MGIYQKLAVATAGAALSLVVSEATPTQAATITYDFTVNVTGGSLSGNQYSGFFSYDDTSTSDASRRWLPYFNVTQFNFEFANQTYTQNDLRVDCRNIQACYPLQITGGEFVTQPSGLPVLTPRGGNLDRIQFGNVSFMGFPSSTSQPLFQFFADATSSFFAYELPGDQGPNLGSGDVTYGLRAEPVPEPNTVFGIGVLSFFGWFLKKKKASSKQV
jgi:hypothetical protein